MNRGGYCYLTRWPGRWRCFARWHGRAFAVALGSWRLTIVPALLLLLAGCATGARVDQVAFDRGAFALAYAGLADSYNVLPTYTNVPGREDMIKAGPRR